MIRFARALMVMALIPGATDMVSAKNEHGYVEIRSGAEQTNPAPAMVITDEHGMLSYYSRGRDHGSSDCYQGIGTYTAESHDGDTWQLAEIKHVLSKRDTTVRDAINAGPVRFYSFDSDSSIQRVETGTYDFIGRMQGNFDKPVERPAGSSHGRIRFRPSA